MRRWSLVLFLVGCAPDADVRPLPAPSPQPWTLADHRPTLEGDFFDAHPGLRDLAWFASAVEGPVDARPAPERRGAFGVGNGHAFGLVGLTDPMNTLHELFGPIYDRGDRFFGDLALRPVVDGVMLDFDHEAVGRPRGAPMVVTRGDVDGVTVTTVDYAPRPGDVLDAPPALVRLVVVRAAEAHDVALRLVGVDDFFPFDGGIETTKGDGRVLRVVAGRPIGIDELGTTLDVGPLGAGEEVVVPLVLGFGDDAEAARIVADTIAARFAAEEAPDLDATLAGWRAEAAAGTQIELDDPVLLDLLDTLRVTLAVQQSSYGGVVPASRYTGTWLRDTIGPVRFWTRLGLFDRARDAVDYLTLCHRKRGDYGNACDSGLRPEDVTTDPPWDELPPFSGRTAAEGPSHVPLAWAEVVRWTGDLSALPSWSYLRRSVLAQSITDDGLQPWSGDETFRLAMEVALGWPLNTAWQDIAWSSNSNAVLIPAASFLADVAAEVAPDDEAALRELADRGRRGLEQFVRPGGHFAAVIVRDPLTKEDRPFEDAALAPIWAGALAPDDPLALANLQGLERIAGRDDGSFQTPPATDLGGDLAEGVATGMLPGYVLWNLVATGHPKHPLALDQLLAYATNSGEFVEGQRYSDRSPMMPLYDPGGVLGDVAARYRPWEGGIDGDALLFALLGATPIEGGLRLVPRVPNGLDHLHAAPILAPGVVADVDLRWDGDGWVAEVGNLGDAPFTLELHLPLGTWDDVDVVAEGGAVGTLPLGERVVRFDPVEVAPGEVVVRVARTGR